MMLFHTEWKKSDFKDGLCAMGHTKIIFLLCKILLCASLVRIVVGLLASTHVTKLCSHERDMKLKKLNRSKMFREANIIVPLSIVYPTHVFSKNISCAFQLKAG